MKWTLLLCLVLVGCQQSIEPTVLNFGDSPSTQGYSGPARLYLYGVADYRHDPWADEDIVPSDTTAYFAAAFAAAVNDWDSARLLMRMEQKLDGQFYTVIAFNAGVHDAAEGVSLSAYRNNLEAIADIAQEHAVYVLWIDSAPDGTGAEDTTPYNVVGEEVAIEHGFCTLSPSFPGSIQPGIHYPLAVYKELGHEVADEVVTILNSGCPSPPH